MKMTRGPLLVGVGMLGIAWAFSPIPLIVLNDLVLLPVSLAVVVVGVLLWVADRAPRGIVARDADGPASSLLTRIVITVELGLMVVLLSLTCVVALVGGGWELQENRIVWLLLMVATYFAGGIYLLARSFTKWKRGSAVGYLLPLLVPLMSVTLVVAVRMLHRGN